MMLNELQWNNGGGLEDLIIWGTMPMLQMLEVWDELYFDEINEDPRRGFFLFDFKDRLKAIEAAICRMDNERMGRRPGKVEVAPNDDISHSPDHLADCQESLLSISDRLRRWVIRWLWLPSFGKGCPPSR